MALEAIELVCGCCELCLYLLDGGSKKGSAAKPEECAAQTARVMRQSREEKRGVRLTFEKRHVSEIEFLIGPAAGKKASELTDMELKRLALSMPHRIARFAIRRFLRNRKKGRVPAEPVIRR